MSQCKHISTPRSSPYHCLSYIQRADRTMAGVHKDAIPVVGNLIGRTPAEQAYEMNALKEHYKDRRRRVGRQFVHLEIGYDKGEGLEVANKMKLPETRVYLMHLRKVTSSALFNDCQWTASLHLNTGRPHWHQVVNTMKRNGGTLKTNCLWERLKEVSDQASRELGLWIIDAKPNAFDTRALEAGYQFIKAELRNKLTAMLKATKGINLIELNQEFAPHGIEIMRQRNQCRLIYKYRGRYYSASRLG